MENDFSEPGEQAHTPSEVRTAADDWLSWLQQMAALFVALAGMASAEGRLAMADAKRLLIAIVALIPFLLLTWLSFCVWLVWLIYTWSGSIGYALFGFFVLQAAVAWYLRVVIKTSRRTLSLPRTRQHLQELLEDLKRGTSGY
jgi:uncharacterized membrane protein YqjE